MFTFSVQDSGDELTLAHAEINTDLVVIDITSGKSYALILKSDINDIIKVLEKLRDS